MLLPKKLLFSLMAASLATGSLMAQTTATGYVFEDSNTNRKRERSEKGIQNVAVSNGREVVLTDKNGKYQLPVGNDDIIFVVKPTGYKVPLNTMNQPQFYYIHKPSGSPDLKYKGVAPTGKLPKS
ncbi:MAG: metallophosphoesterase N-terminal domain-containing protein, partial [Sphingobacteriaceae bacterium]